MQSTATILDKTEYKETADTLVKELAFTRYNAHIEGEKAEVKQAIERAVNFVGSAKQQTPHLATLCKQIGTYYLFCLRDERNAVFYLEKFRSMSPLKGTEDYADASLWLGYAKTITGTYRDPKEIRAALFGYKALAESKKSSKLEVDLKRAVAYCFSGLMYHRLAMYSNDAREKESNFLLAEEQLEKAQKIQESHLEEFSSLQMELANTLHIRAAVFLAQGKFRLASKYLKFSSEYSQDFCDETQHEHFMRLTTLQTRAACLINSPSSRQAQYEEASRLLVEACHGQKVLFGTSEHPDIAKTLHFHGEALEKLDNLTLARQQFEAALKIKEKFLPPGDPIRVKTEQAIARLDTKLASAAAAQHQSEQAPGTTPTFAN